jgi:transposase
VNIWTRVLFDFSNRAKLVGMNKTKSAAERSARVNRPERTQVEMQLLCLDEMLPQDHRARIVWQFIKSWDLEAFYLAIQVSDTQAGRSAIAPEILLGLWLLATLDGISSARELDRRCSTDIPYRWMCGRVSVNYHTLSDFRVQHGQKLDQILTDTIAALMHQKLINLDELGQDGMRVRASAGSSSFRRTPTLQRLQEEAKKHVDKLREDSKNEANHQASSDRRKSAQERAAREQQERIAKALEEAAKLSEQREKRKKGDGATTRTSTTDSDARRMKMGDGGFRPAYNVQFATDGEARMIVAVEVTNEGTDGGQMVPMLDEVTARYEKTPDRILVDSAFATKDSVTEAERGGTKVISTVPRAEQLRKHGKDPHARQKGDTDEYAAFRARMGEPEQQELYKKRPSIAEFPNADCRNRGLHQFRVRGLVKVKAVVLWHVLAFNFTRMINLGVMN